MRHRTAALLFAAAAATGAAAVGATAAALVSIRADERHRMTYQALSRAFFTVPWDRLPYEDVPEGQRAALVPPPRRPGQLTACPEGLPGNPA